MQMQRQRVILYAVWAELLLGGGAVQLRGGEQFFSFDYSQHGEDWVSGSCSSRARQSPIDLPAAAMATGAFTYKYKPIAQPFDFMNNGHSLSADFAGLDYGGITYNDAWYELMNVNVHSLSEHSWMGERKPLEIHMVHKHFANENLLIVAIGVESATALPAFMQINASSKAGPQMAAYAPGYLEPPTTDPNFNPSLQPFVKLQPPAVNMKVSVPMNNDNFLDFNAVLTGAQYYEYAGSLTAPPCAEIATWLVRKDILKASDKQVLYLHDAVYKSTADFGNYRNLMPMNGRQVTLRQGMLEDPPQNKNAPPPMPGNPQASDRDFRAMKWAMDAMTIAKGATDYIKDLDMRLRNAAQAHADALAPRLEPLSPGEKEGPGIAVVGSGDLAAPGPIEMEATAKQMAQTLAEAARQEVDSATEKITKEAKEAAIKAALEAAGIVKNGQGNPEALANSVAVGAAGPGAQPGQPSAGPQPGEPPPAR